MSLKMYANYKLGTSEELTTVTRCSVNEYLTGKFWIDGKPIFGRVFPFLNLNNSADNIVGTVNNVETPMPLTGVAVRGSENITLPNVERGGFDWSIGLKFDKNNGNIVISKGAWGTYSNGYIIFEYTKKN